MAVCIIAIIREKIVKKQDAKTMCKLRLTYYFSLWKEMEQYVVVMETGMSEINYIGSLPE